MNLHNIKTCIRYLAAITIFLTFIACGNDEKKRMSKADMIPSQAAEFLFNAEDFDLAMITDLVKNNKVSNLEELETRINSEESGISNVDIDGDEMIDVILVRDSQDESTGLLIVSFYAVPSKTQKEDDKTFLCSIDISQNKEKNTTEYSANYPDYAEGYQEHSYNYSIPHVYGTPYPRRSFFGYMFSPAYVPYHPAFMYPVGYHRVYMSPAVRMQTRNSYRSTTSTTRTVTKTTRSKNYKPSKSVQAATSKTRKNIKSGKVKPSKQMAARNNQRKKEFKKRDSARKQKAATGFGGNNQNTKRSNSRSLNNKSKSTPTKQKKSFGGFGGNKKSQAPTRSRPSRSRSSSRRRRR